MSTETAGLMHSTVADRSRYYDLIGQAHLAPLWESLHDLVTTFPVTPAVPVLWDYDNVVRAHLMEAGRIITAREAERRVLMLENPGLRGKASITHSLYAGAQLVLPGDIARAHRHSQSALRFVIEGQNGYTTVDGERTLMQPGDFITTPGWTWHDHGNPTDRPVIWIDILDLPLVTHLGGSFAESSAVESQAVTKPLGDSSARYAQNMLPVDWKPTSKSSPIFNYPYVRSRETLTTLSHNGEPDRCHGYKMRYINPATGGYALPTIGTFIQLLPSGFDTAPYRVTDGTIFIVVEGEGETRIGDVILKWKPRDVFVVPSWASHTHHARGEAVLFSASDRPVQEALGLWREERMDGASMRAP
jgi:gentisate 1,2-dioxygenase